MTRLRTPATLARFAGNFALAVLGTAIFFGVVHLANLDQERAAIQDALDARAAAESPLQRAARAVCNDHPARAGRRIEPSWTPDGQLECHIVIAQENPQ